jgi:hypothetical protein
LKFTEKNVKETQGKATEATDLAERVRESAEFKLYTSRGVGDVSGATTGKGSHPRRTSPPKLLLKISGFMPNGEQVSK